MAIKARSAKSKGRKLERWLEDELKALGLTAVRRQPGSGAFEAFPHDVSAELPDGKPVLFEAKQRKAVAWATGDRWIGSADALVVRLDAPRPFDKTPPPRVYMSWDLFARLVSLARKEN